MMTDIWAIPFEHLDYSQDDVLQLSPAERHKAKKFIRKKDQRNYLISHIYLQRILASYFPSLPPSQLVYQYSQFSKPSLHGKEEFYFNLSHTHSCAYVICSDEGACGIDVEEEQNFEITDSLCKLIFSNEELELYRRFQGEEAKEIFYKCWTLKEAHLKALGTGLREMPLTHFSFANMLLANIDHKGFIKKDAIYWSHKTDDRYYLAFCILSSKLKNSIKYRSIQEL